MDVSSYDKVIASGIDHCWDCLGMVNDKGPVVPKDDWGILTMKGELWGIYMWV